MTLPSIAAYTLAVLIIATRAPLIFAPQATIRVYRRMMKTNGRLRALAGFFGLLGVAGLAATWGVRGDGVDILKIFAGIICLSSAWMLALPAGYRRYADAMLEILDDPTVLRLLGALGVLIGAAFAWLGDSLR